MPWRVSLVVLLVCLSSIGVLIVLGWWATTTVDRSAVEREMSFARTGLDDSFARIPKEQESSAIWDEAVDKVKAGDQGWMKENLGEWMGSYFGHNRVFILDDRNVPVHAMEDGGTLPAAGEAYADDRATVEPLVSKLRRQINESTRGLTDSTDAIAGIGVEDYVLLDGLPAIVSVKPIIPSTDARAQEPGSEYLHVSIRFLDPSFVADIAEKYQLADAEVTTDQRDLTDGAVPIINSAGDVLAKFTWEPYRPGLSMIERMAPTIAITAIPIAALLVWLTRHLWRSTQELHFMAYHDAMTGLPNRLLFNIRLRDALEKARRSGGAVAVMMIDLDRFKHVNDSLGHPAGDELICQVSERLKSCVGSSATFARLGGDEFAAVVSSIAHTSDIENLAEHLLSEMERPFVIGGEQVVTSVSIGVALATGERISHSDLLRRADIALYEAKSKGRKRYQVFFDELSDIVLRRRAIEQDLRVALETGTIVAAYQPVFDGRGEKMVGAEALVRWHHPVHGALSPDVFISIAEERGLIEALGDRVILVACQLLQETSIPWISINLSAYQLRNEGFATHLKSALAEKEIEAYRLQVEIRESVLMANDPTTRANLNHLHAAGIKITLDDFGTGYSSLNDLREYPVDKVKIDRSLVGQLASSQECEAIARAFVSLAKSLGKTVAVEGVETADDRIHVLSLMCDEMQGYAISRPLSPLQLRSQFAELWESNPGRRSIAVCIGAGYARGL